VLTRPVIAPREAAAGDLTDRHRGCTIDTQAFDGWRGRCRLVFFSLLAHMASVSAIFFCGVALTTWRRRKPRRLSTSAIVLGEGHGSFSSPWALTASSAALAVSRVEASVVRHGGSCCAGASASRPSASAASGSCSSQRVRLLQADCAPTTREARASLGTPHGNRPTPPTEDRFGQ
jgi:hypothetical protein